jgi:hypothetical protein
MKKNTNSIFNTSFFDDKTCRIYKLVEINKFIFFTCNSKSQLLSIKKEKKFKNSEIKNIN